MDTAAVAFSDSLSRASSSASRLRPQNTSIVSPTGARQTHTIATSRQSRTAPAPRTQPTISPPAPASKTAPTVSPRPFVTNERRGLISRQDLPDPLANTLDHIVGQLALIAETMALIDSRLTATEDRVSSIAEYLRETRGYEGSTSALPTTSSNEGAFNFNSGSTGVVSDSVAMSAAPTSQASSRQPSPKWQSSSGFSFEYGSGSSAASAPNVTSTTADLEPVITTSSVTTSAPLLTDSSLPVVSDKYDTALTSTIASIIRSHSNASPRAVASVSGVIRDFAANTPATNTVTSGRYTYNQEPEDEEDEIIDEEDLYNGADADNGDVEEVGDYDEEDEEDELHDEFA